jgi:hypothetical protein
MFFPSINPSVIIFFYYRQKIHQRSIFVGDFVGKLITNEMIVQIPTKNSVDKYKDYGSGEGHNGHMN